MGLVKAQVELKYDTGLPQDVAINTLYFHTPATPASGTSRLAIIGTVQAFYDALSGGQTNEISSYLGPHVDQLAARLKLYNMTDPEPRAPVSDVALPLTNVSAADPLPEEVALCLSFQGVVSSGVSQARRRGRIYLGPLNDNGFDPTSGRPSDTFLEDVTIAAAAMIADNDANHTWVVYSPTTDPTPTGLTTGVDVDNGWVDDAWDTQRRRGLIPTRRETFS